MNTGETIEQGLDDVIFKPKKHFNYWIILILLVVGGIGFLIYEITISSDSLNTPAVNNKSSQVTDNPADENDINYIISKVGKIITLPAGEQPTLATVTDLQKLQGQNFFKNAQEGDKVLVYSTAKKAYLYRPSEDRLIEVGVVNLPK